MIYRFCLIVCLGFLLSACAASEKSRRAAQSEVVVAHDDHVILKQRAFGLYTSRESNDQLAAEICGNNAKAASYAREFDGAFYSFDMPGHYYVYDCFGPVTAKKTAPTAIVPVRSATHLTGGLWIQAYQAFTLANTYHSTEVFKDGCRYAVPTKLESTPMRLLGSGEMTWREVWTVNRCGTPATYNSTFVLSQQKGLAGTFELKR